MKNFQFRLVRNFLQFETKRKRTQAGIFQPGNPDTTGYPVLILVFQFMTS